MLLLNMLMVIEIVAKKNDHGHQSTCGYPELVDVKALVDAKSFVDITALMDTKVL